MWGDNVWTAIWSAGLAATGGICIAVINALAARRREATVKVTPSVELEALAERFTEELDEARSLAYQLRGQFLELARSVDKVDGVRERVGVLESGVHRIEALLSDLNTYVHGIGHKQANLDMKVETIGRLVRLPMEERNPEKGERQP